jgi:hypothetical protein
VNGKLRVAEDVIMGIERVGAFAYRADRYAKALIHFEQVGALKAIQKLPSAFTAMEHQAMREVEEAARNLTDLPRAGLVAEQLAPKALEKLSRRFVLESFGAVHALQLGAEKQLAPDVLKLWQQLSIRPEFAAIQAKLGRAGFEELVGFGKGLKPVPAAKFEAAITMKLKGRTNEIMTDLNSQWHGHLRFAGERGGQLLQILPEPSRWHFSYQRSDVHALAFGDLERAATPAPLLDALTEVQAAELPLSKLTTKLLQWVDKSAWMIYDDSALRVGLPLLFGESKGLRNLRDLLVQFPKDLERGGLGLALIDGKETLVMMVPALARPQLVGIAPRLMSERMAERIAGSTGADVIPLNIGVPNRDGLEFAGELGVLLGLRH